VRFQIGFQMKSLEERDNVFGKFEEGYLPPGSSFGN